jgi:CRP/FNR family transcriptional regulator, cyclic AMP receptor protein
MNRPSSPILDALPEPARRRLRERAVSRRLVRGERLHAGGDSGKRVHLVESGVLLLVAGDAEGHETILSLALPGEIAGEIAALDGRHQPLDAVAALRTTVVGFDAGLFVDIVMGHSASALELARLLAKRTRWIADIALERTSGEVPARLAGRLLDLAVLLGRTGAGGIDLELPFAQEDLGRLAGMCRESACKTLRRFRAEGVLDYRGRRMRILRPDLLERLRCSAHPFRDHGLPSVRR